MGIAFWVVFLATPAWAQEGDGLGLPQEDSADIHLDAGEKSFADGDFANAIAEFTKAIDIDPTSWRAYRMRGRAQHRIARFKEAIADYSKAIDLNPRDAGYYGSRAHALHSLGEWEASLRDFRRGCALEPATVDYPRLFVWLIRARLGEREAATAELRAYISKRERQENDGWYLKVAGFVTGDAREADFLKAAESADPKQDREQKCEAFFYAGARRLLDGDETGARDLFRKVLATKVDAFVETFAAQAELARLELRADSTARAYLERGRERQLRRDFRGALDEYTKAIEVDPDFGDAYGARASARRAMMDLDGAIQDELKAIELALERHHEARSWSDAVTSFRRAARLHPPAMAIQALLVGWLEPMRAGKPDRAARELRDILMTSSRDIRDPWFQAVAGFLQGQGRDADVLKAASESSDRKDVRTRESRFWIGMKAAVDGDLESALEHLKACLEMAEPNDGLLAVVADASGVDVLIDRSRVQGKERLTIREAAAPPAPPAGMTAIGKAYEIELPGRATPALVRLPLPDPKVAKDPTRAIFVGHHDGTDWEIVPARIVDGKAAVEVSHFSLLEVLMSPFRKDPARFPVEKVQITLPKFRGLLVEGDAAWAEFDTIISFWLKSKDGEELWADRIRVYVSRPGTSYEPYRNGGRDVFLKPEDKQSRIPLVFDPDAVMRVDADTKVTAGAWNVKFAPVYADGREGPLTSDAVTIPVAAAEAHLKLRRGLLARMTPEQAADFERLTERNPYYIVFDHRQWNNDSTSMSTLSECYSSRVIAQARKTRNAFWLGEGGAAYVGMFSTSEFWRVICHEWGHYAYNLMLGDEAFSQLPAAKHTTWTDDTNSRGIAWAEDVASYLGQYGTQRGLPARAGSLRGNVQDHSKKCAWQPASSYWPENPQMDVPAVEAIPATILSRATIRFQFPRVYDVLRLGRPTDLIELFEAWGASRQDLAEMQRIYLDECVTWKVKGRVLGRADKDKKPEPLEGARVRVQSVTGEILGSAVAVTDVEGRFELRVPPGIVQFDVQLKKWKASAPFRFTANTDDSTLMEAQAMPDFVMKPADEARLLFGTQDRGRACVVISAAAADSSGVEKIGELPRGVTLAAWSRDGRRMAVTRDAKDDTDIGVADADGSNLRWLTARALRNTLPSWSPDGGRLAFFSTRESDVDEERKWFGGSDLFVMREDGSDVRKLVEIDGSRRKFDSLPVSWSPNGGKIVFSRGRNDPDDAMYPNYDLYIVNSDGGGLRALMQSPVWEQKAAWSPDGRKIAFHECHGEGPNTFRVMDVDGSNVRTLGTDEASVDARAPVWSPDGRRIAFVKDTVEIDVVEADGSGVRAVARSKNRIASMAWSPDCKRVAFDDMETGGGRSVYVVDADGANFKKVGAGMQPAWSVAR
ncbi:MAG: PD40 domain-containing protein [Planctomycetes bacterium]|nr:PD40 domain-containing protein [Planctomycetota bacterium]